MTKHSKRAPKAPRGIEVLTAILHCKGAPHRNKTEKRKAQKERRVSANEW